MAITLTQEQFKQRYGQEGLDAFKSPAEINTPQEKPGFFSRAGTALKKRFGEVKKTFGETARGEISPVETGVRLVGDVAGGVGDVVGAALSPQVEKLAQKEWAKPAFEALAGGMEKYEEWKNSSELNRRTAEVLEGVVNIADLAGISAGAKATVKTTAKVAGKVAKEVADTVGDVARGVKSTGIAQKITELAERVPRAVGRAKESLGESKLKAGKIRESSPSVQKAYKANLDERIINTVVQADEPTKQAYKQMVDIAEESSDVLKIKKKPSSIAGDVVSKQYKLIEKQRKNIGEQMNEATKKLSKDRSISMEDGFRQADDILGSQGIKINYTKKGAKLDFTGTKFTPSERTRIQELYSLAVEGGNKLSPNQVHLKDQLFSKLQRESRMEGVGDIMVETAEGNKSLFNVFRDIYSNKLDEVFPEIKDLNKQYREIKTLLDDIEGSIIKGGNFEVVKSTDPSVFAQTNLRRILSDAQSAGSYSEIVKKMDEFARTLGYEGAKADELILFAEELKKLYPDTISKTGFSGGISTGIKSATLDLIGGILKTGTPNLKDQQKALKALLGIDDVILPKLNKPLNTGSKINVNLPKAGIEVKNTKIDANLPKNKVDKVELPQKSSGINNLTEEARKYKSADEFIKAQGTPVYHGGAGVDELSKSVKILSPEDKLKYPSSGGGYIGLSTSPDKSYAQQYSRQIAGRDDVAELFIQPNAKIKNIKGAIDDMSADELEKLSKKFDVLKSVEDNEFRILNENIIKTKSQLTDIWNKAQEKSTAKIDANLPKYISTSQKKNKLH